MKANTKNFGEIEIAEERVITFEGGIIGFPELTRFALLHDEEKGDGAGIHWLQSLQEPAFAIPVLDPLLIVPDYNPEVEDELLKPLGEIGEEGLLVLVTVTVPADIKRMSINLQGPIVINAGTRKACQVIVDGELYKVKFPVYDLLQSRKKAGE